MRDFPDLVTRLPELAIDLPGVSGHLLQAEHHQVAFIRFDQDIVVPEHAHATQWEIVLSGEVELTVGGCTRSYRAGESFCIPAGEPHGAHVKAGYRAVILFEEASRYRAR
jgi:quercetin dioxygenase-like cupin family protein